MKHKRKQRESIVPPKQEAQSTVTLKLEFVIPENLIANFSDHFFASYVDDAFVLSFFQTQHPADLREDSLKKERSIKTPCVSRVIVTPDQMSKIIDALIVNYNRWLETRGDQTETETQDVQETPEEQSEIK